MSRHRLAIYPGSFDPVTNGHLDIIRRAARMFDHVIVAVSADSHKTPTFSLQERQVFLKNALRADLRRGNVSVDAFQGLLVQYARRKGAVALVRGLRAVSDFEYEFQMALMNRRLAPGLEAVFLMPDEKYTYLSSALIKEISRLGGGVERFVPPGLVPLLRKKLAGRSS